MCGRWLYLPLVILGGFYLSLHLVQHSNWYKDRLYRQLLNGSSAEQIRAAGALAVFDGQAQLLAALKTEAPAVRDLARRALEYLWFRAAGHEANQMIENACQAADKNDFQAALALLDRLVQKYPRYAEAWNRRASVYWQMGEYKKSIADCEKALAINPNHYGAWQGIGVCQVQLGDVSEACRCLRAALRITPYDETTRHCLEKCEELLKVLPMPERPRRRDDLI